MKLKYIGRLHRELQRACPEGYSVQAIRENRRLLTLVTCEDADYFAPWLVSEIVEPFGFSVIYA